MPKKILIVEDDKFLRELIVKKLKSADYEVVEAIDGESAVVKAKELKPDLILLDLILPGIDGFGILTKIKEDSVIKQIPVIILSNLSQQEEIDKAMKLGAADFLIKAHFVPGEIIEKIKKIIN